jgi:hypothetical protein
MVIRLHMRITYLFYEMPRTLHHSSAALRERSEVNAPAEADGMRRQHLIARGIPVFFGDLAPFRRMEIVGNSRDFPLPCAVLGLTGKFLPYGCRS